jgi:hypothetical protein
MAMASDNPYLQFENDDASFVVEPTKEAPENPYSQFENDADANDTIVPKGQSAPTQTDLPSTPGASFASDPETNDAISRLDAINKREGTDRLNEARGSSFVEGLVDPQQYKEFIKGPASGAVSMLALPPALGAALQTRGQSNAGAFGRDQIEVMNRIDRGESVPDTSDAYGYQHQSPDQRKATRADAERAAAAFNPTPLTERALYKASESVKDFARTILPPVSGYEESVGRQLGEGVGSLIAGLPFGLAGRIPAGLFFGAAGGGEALERAVQFDQTERAAGRPGLSEDEITKAAMLGVAPGTTDMLPLEVLMGRLKIPLPWRATFARVLGRIGGQALTEGVQEGGQQFLQNLIAEETYNPKQALGEGMVPNTAMGAGVGGIAQTAQEVVKLLAKSAGGRRGGTAGQAPAPAPTAPAAEPAVQQPAAGAEQPLEPASEAVTPEQAAAPPVEAAPTGEQPVADDATQEVVSPERADYLARLDAMDEELETLTKDDYLVDHSPLKTALRVATSASSPDFGDATKSVQAALELGRTDIAETIIERVERSAADMATKEPALPVGHKNYATAKAMLAKEATRRAEEATNLRALHPKAPSQTAQPFEDADAQEASPELLAMAARLRGLAPEQIDKVRALIKQQAPELAQGFEELLAYQPKPKAGKKAKAAPGAATAATSPLLPKSMGALPSRMRGEAAPSNTFTDQVLAIADTLKTPTVRGATFDGRVSIAQVYDAYAAKHDDAGTLEEFKARLVDTAKKDPERRLGLGRLDLPERMDKTLRQRSEAMWGGQEVHFVLQSEPSAARPAADAARQLRASFATILDSKTPRSQWAKKLGVSDAEMAPLIDEAVAKNWLRKDKSGNIRRTPVAQRSGEFAAMAVPNAAEFARRFEEAFGGGTEAAQVAPMALPGTKRNLPLSPAPAGPTPGLTPSAPGSLIDIQRELRRRLGLTVAKGRLDPALSRAVSMSGGTLMGQFSRKTEVIRLRVLQDIDTEAHEVGHALESRYPLAGLQNAHAAELHGVAALTGQQGLSEGFAEFFRLYLTNPQAATAHAPGFMTAFEEFMDAEDPQTLQDIQEIRDQYQQWRNASSAGRLTAAIKSGVPKTTWQEIRKEHSQGGLTSVGGMFWRYLEQVYKSRIDKTNPIRVLVQRIARQAEENNQGLDLTAWRNPQMQAQKIGSADGASYIDITRGVHWENANGQGTVNLRDALATAFGGMQYDQWTDEQRDAFGAYLIARRGRWLWQRFEMNPAQDRGRLANPPQNPQTGDWYFDTMRRQRRVFLGNRWEAELTHAPDKHTRGDHEMTVSELDTANAGFDAAAQMVYQFSRDLALKRYQAGLDSQEEYEHKLNSPDYVPWFRDMSDQIFGSSSALSGRKVAQKFKLRGSYRDFIHPIEGIARQVFDTNFEIAVNKPKLLLAQMADAVTGAGRYAEIVPATRMRSQEIKVRDALEAAARKEGLPPEDAKEMISAVAAMIGDDAVATLFRSEQAGDGKDVILHYMEGGQLKMLQIHDDGHGIAKDILGFFETVRGTPMADSFFGMVTAAVRIPQKGITTGFGFMWRNLIRDTFQASALQAGYFPLVSNIRTIASNRARINRGDETWGDILARHGGIMGGIGRTDIQLLQSGRISELRTDGVTLEPWRRDFWARTINPWHEDFWKWAEWTESNARQTIARISFNRAIADVQSRYPTMPPEQQTFIALEAAVQRSRDYTDYGRMGAAPSQMVANRTIMFFNPALQGPDKMVRAAFLAQTNEGRFASAQLIRKKLLPLFSDRQFQKLTKSEVDALKDAARMWVTIAIIAHAHLLFELAFNTPEERKDKSKMERALYVTFTINGQPYKIPRGFDIINVASNAVRATYDSWFDEDPTAWERFRQTLALSLLPPASSPLLDLYIGWKHNRNNFFESAIEPEYMQGKMPEDRYTAYTSNLSRRFAEAIQPIAPFDVSPIMVEYTMNAIGSDWSRDILRAYDTLDPEKPELRWQEYPFIRTTRGSRSSRGSEDYWDLMGRDGVFAQAGASYKSEAVDNKAWSKDDIRKFFDVRMKDDDAKAFAILNGHYDKDQRSLHPMVRAQDMIRAVSATQRDVVANRIDVRVTSKLDNRTEVSREARGAAVEILAEINRREPLNALIALQRPGYEKREPMPIKPYLEELETISPEIAGVLREKIIKRSSNGGTISRIYDYDEVRASWPEMKRTLLAKDKIEEIIEQTGQVEFKDFLGPAAGARAIGLR